MASLTQQEIAAYCTEYLNPVTLYIGRKMGPEAADLTGMCLLKALHAFDTSRTSTSSLAAWLRSKTRYLVIEALRQQDGRKGSAKYQAHSTQGTLEDFDAVAETPDAVETSEALTDALHKIAKASRVQRWLLFGGLYEFSHADIQDITHASEDTIYKEAADLRRLLQSH